MLTFLKAWLVTRVGQYLPKDEKGQDAAEYGLLIGLVALAIILAVLALGGNLNAIFTAIATRIGAVPIP